MSSHGPRMDVKVLYTLDSSPNHTMVARLGRSIPVEVIIPNMTPPSPVGPSGSNYHQSPAAHQVRFGRIALKTCLGAVCMASPELLPDDKKDFIIYAVDPEETLRANQLRSPSSRGHASPTRASSSTSSRERNDASTSKLDSSPPRPKDAATSILVGKGFFNWALEEEGDGETTVTGRVRSDGRRLRYDNGREYEEDINVLEVVIKLKESQARSKDKYFNLVRGLSSGSSFSAGPSASSSSSSIARSAPRQASQVEVVSAAQRFRSSRHVESDSHLSLHSEPDYPTSSSYGAMERQIRRPAVRPSPHSMPLADRTSDRVISPKTALQPLGTSPGLPLAASFSANSSPPAPSANSPNSALSSAASNPSTLQLLTILHSLQQRSSKSAPEPAQQAQLESLLQQVAQVFGNSANSSPAADATEAAAADPSSSSPALSTRPLDPIPVPNSRSSIASSDSDVALSRSGKENRNLGLPAQDGSKDSPQTGSSDSRRQSAASPSFDGEDSASPSLQRREAQDTSDRICYNCGTDVPTTWRILKLPAGSIVNNPAAEKGAGSDGNSDEAAEPGWKPRFAGKDSPVETDGETRWSACNPCGLYYLKWNNSRPEYVWRKEHATKAYRERKALAEAAKRRRETFEASGPSKRPRISHSDVDAASPYTVGTPRDANTSMNRAAYGDSDESMTSPNFDAATPVSSSGRKGSMPRTLSEACHRDAEKLESQRSSKKKDKEKPICKKQADREYVLDPSTGKWRSRRSMRENPEGKRPGRPKGSVKVPQNAKPAAKSSPATSSGKDASSTPAAQPAVKGESSTTTAKQSTSSSASKVKAAQQQQQRQQMEQSQQQQQEFRAPMPPQVGRQINSSRMVNFAQSSPVRPSMNASLMQPDAINAMPSFGSGMLESPSRDVRFRVPSYLMNSSPGTMLDTLMSEADFDFEELGPLGPLQTPGTLLGNMARGGQHTPQRLRRSPRKNPHGTISGSNPYASPSSKRSTSPSLGRDIRKGSSSHVVDMHGGGSPSARSAAASSNDSPVTRSRTRSGQNVLHPALYSSSDGPGNANEKSSSNVTSPASPSEKRAAGGAGGKSKTTSSLHNTGKSALTLKHGQVASSSTRRQTSPNMAEEEDEPESHFVKGPYRENSAGLPSCPASPSLGRATRKFARNLSSGPAKLAQLDLPPSSPVFDHPTGRSNGSTVEVDGWGRTPSMREIFPTPSDLDWPSDASSAASQSPVKDPAEAGDKTVGEVKPVESEELTVPTSAANHAVVRRRPLPATVEDGSSSVSGSSPALSDDSPEGGNGNLFDLLEDPYGILAASGFGIDADGALTSLEIPINPPADTSQSMTPTSSAAAGPAPQPSISADNFSEIQLHQSDKFRTHLSEFNSSGGSGIAAHVAGDSSAAAVQIANAPSTSTGTGTGTSAGIGLDASFLANLPPELSTIFTSPKKPLPPQIIEILASPRKNSNGRARTSSSTSPTKVGSGGGGGGEMVVSPHTGGGFAGAEGDEQDFSALFSNPDIQALLAEFEASA
ncbi:uncharacterized protein UTRI_04725_B [Ustilago trichophora]|uniref:Ams2/SPT21 N-terminal domain-containing protein n=1 Tax=Ustilago trichophora TaxID=86804 RepID=A0A5C3EGZ0_9BASI|nr:uncharacterized protein UTRI_04725_B [Ustilago trichophora]